MQQSHEDNTVDILKSIVPYPIERLSGGTNVTCVSDPDDPCTGEFNLGGSSNGCLECKCSSSGGGCDMVKGGGIIVSPGIFMDGDHQVILN